MNTTREGLERQGDPILAPWGHPPTPLLPRWYRENLAQQSLPTQIKRLNPAVERIGNLDTFWDTYQQPLDRASMNSLAHLAGTHRPPPSCRVLPVDFDLNALLSLPLKPRTHNCIWRALQMNCLKDATVGAFMRLTNFGILSLIELMCVTEMMIDPSTTMRHAHEREIEPSEPANEEPKQWTRVDRPLDTIIAIAREFYGAQTLGDILRSDLSRVISAAGLDHAVDEIHLPEVDPPLASDVIDKLAIELEKMNSTERLIIDERLFVDDSMTLKQLGRTTGLSRERMRQLERKLRRSLDEAVGSSIRILADVVSERLGPVTTELELEDHIVQVLDVRDHHHEAVRHHGADRLAGRMLRDRLDYSCRDRVCLSRDAVETARTLKDAAIAVADDVGLVYENDLLSHLPSPEWAEYLPALINRSDLHRLSNYVGLRTTAKAQAKAALISIGRPATKEEIGDIAGLNPARVAGHLSSIPSVARADKIRWGLRDWIDDVYEGIPAEIIQRIEEDGGSTRLNRLLDELPRLFGVNEMSVRAYVGTPAFRVEHGWVSIAEEPDCVIGRFRDVASGRNSDGKLYWAFPMHERYLRGFSIVGVPPELAVELGCGFGGKATVAVRMPQGSRPVSVNWRKTALTGPEIGRLADAMKAIGAREGDRICLVLHDNHEISFTRPEPTMVNQITTDGTAAPIPPLRLIEGHTPSVEGPYLGVRTGTPIAARLKTFTPPLATPQDQDQDSYPQSQPPSPKD